MEAVKGVPQIHSSVLALPNPLFCPLSCTNSQHFPVSCCIASRTSLRRSSQECYRGSTPLQLSVGKQRACPCGASFVDPPGVSLHSVLTKQRLVAFSTPNRRPLSCSKVWDHGSLSCSLRVSSLTDRSPSETCGKGTEPSCEIPEQSPPTTSAQVGSGCSINAEAGELDRLQLSLAVTSHALRLLYSTVFIAFLQKWRQEGGSYGKKSALSILGPAWQQNEDVEDTNKKHSEWAGSGLPSPGWSKIGQVAACAAAIGLWIPAAAHAMDGAAIPQALWTTGEAKLRAAWPKILQVLDVMRTQGLLLGCLLGISAFFSLAETSITTLWPWKVRELAEKESEGGTFQLLQQDVTRFLTTILIGSTVANIAATSLVTEAALTLFGEAGVAGSTAVMTVVVLLLTEIAPKSIAVHNATDIARIVVRPVGWISIVLYPVGRFCTMLSKSLLSLLGLKSSGEPFVSEDEIKLMLRQAEIGGAIEEEEQDMIENVLEIKDTYVREVMTPLVDVVAIDIDATLMEFRNLWIKHQYSRVPVYERRVDNIIGIAYAMDIIDYMGDEVKQAELLQRLTVGRIAHKPAYFVPDSMSVWNLLREFRIRKVHMAIVLNEYGGTVGLVTLEDVVEEIVGEIFDENDSKEEIRKKTGYVVQRADGIYDVDANTSIEELAQTLEVIIPEGPFHYETVSGFVCETFGYIPRTGESCTIGLKSAERGSSDRDEDHREKERRESDRERDSERAEERRQQPVRFRIEILAGNARKVSSVRIERLEKSTTTANESPPRGGNGDDFNHRSQSSSSSSSRSGTMSTRRNNSTTTSRDEPEDLPLRVGGGAGTLVRVVDSTKWLAIGAEGGRELEGEGEEGEEGDGERRRGEREDDVSEEEVVSSSELGTDSDDERDEFEAGAYLGGRRWRPFAEGVDVTSREEENSIAYRRDEEGLGEGTSRRNWVRADDDVAVPDSLEGSPDSTMGGEEGGDSGAGNNTVTAPWRWEEKVKQVDRRRQRRMKQSAEAAAELNRSQRRPEDRLRRGIQAGTNSNIAAYVVARRRQELVDHPEPEETPLARGSHNLNGHAKDDSNSSKSRP